ncbi:MAG: YihY/virulence factor BrkB family protein [Bacteroidales bacterium]|nr:YihY/virulence factor BrkB family protein [Bacteroidales bacterium]
MENIKNPNKSFQQRIKNITKFFTSEIWRIPVDELTKGKSFVIKLVRIIVLAIRGFIEDKVQLRASALTYYSMLSVVPIAAMAFGIAKGFGFEKALERQLSKNLSGQEEVLTWIIQFANNMLEKAKGGWIAGVGVVVLFWAVMKVLGNIEESFNGIWQIKKSRGFARKFTDYLSIMLILPILLILSSSASVYITSQIKQLTANVEIIGYIKPLMFFLIKLIPYVLIWIVFTLLYIIMPNTKVSFQSGVIAGLIAGTIFQLVQWVYIYFQVGVSRYGAIYGGFAALPLFLIWLHISWTIVLFGAEISFATQNVHKYEFETESKNLSTSFKRLLTLLIANLIVKNFDEEDEPLSAPDISRHYRIPIRIVREILDDLVESRVITEISSGKSVERSYQPALDINKITINFVLDRLENRGSSILLTSRPEEFNKIEDSLETFKQLMTKSDKNVLLKDI